MTGSVESVLSLRRVSEAVLDLKRVAGWRVSAVDSVILCGCFSQDSEG